MAKISETLISRSLGSSSVRLHLPSGCIANQHSILPSGCIANQHSTAVHMRAWLQKDATNTEKLQKIEARAQRKKAEEELEREMQSG